MTVNAVDVLIRITLALLIALPLGPGGLCCCLFGPADAACDRVPAEPAGCCSQEAAPESGAADCECPAREVVVLSGTGTVVSLELPGTTTVALTPAMRSVARIDDLRPEAPSPTPPAQPRVPLFRSLSVIRC